MPAADPGGSCLTDRPRSRSERARSGADGWSTSARRPIGGRRATAAARRSGCAPGATGTGRSATAARKGASSWAARRSCAKRSGITGIRWRARSSTAMRSETAVVAGPAARRCPPIAVTAAEGTDVQVVGDPPPAAVEFEACSCARNAALSSTVEVATACARSTTDEESTDSNAGSEGVGDAPVDDGGPGRADAGGAGPGDGSAPAGGGDAARRAVALAPSRRCPLWSVRTRGTVRRHFVWKTRWVLASGTCTSRWKWRCGKASGVPVASLPWVASAISASSVFSG